MELRNFYKFVAIKNLLNTQKAILRKGEELGIKGTILLAHEGINAAIAGSSAEAVEEMFCFIETSLETTFTPLITNLEEKDPDNPALPFRKFKVRIRNEIVTLGMDGLDPACNTGVFVQPKDWNALISDPETITIDTRNIYEYHIGHFKNAINPDTPNFTDFIDYVKKNNEAKLHRYKNVAMYCTGGIRCEKASSMMKELGLHNTYQLHGGILAYFQHIALEDSLWEGACFVFDDRIAVNHDMTPSVLKKDQLPQALHMEKNRSRHDGFVYSKIMSISE